MRFILKGKDGVPMTSHATAEDAKVAVTNIQPGVIWVTGSSPGNLVGWLNERVAYTIERE